MAQHVELVLPDGDHVPARLNTHARGQGRLSGNWLETQDALGLGCPDQVLLAILWTHVNVRGTSP